MRYLLPILMFFSVIVPASAQINNTDLVAYYPLNGDFLDYSGNGHHGTGHGNILFTADRWGNTNAAAQFDGIDDWIEIPSSLQLGQIFSIALTIRMDTLSPQMIMAKSDSTGNNQQFHLGYDLPPVLPADSGIMFGTSHTGVCSTNANSVAYHCHHPSFASVNPLNWFCITFTSQFTNNAKTLTMHQSSTAWGGTYGGIQVTIDSCAPGILKIGKWRNSNPLLFRGKIDEIRIYKRKFISSELAAGNSPPFCGSTAPMSINMSTAALSFCQDSAKVFNLPYVSNNSFASGNVFTAQLSNSSGTFTSPTTIGSATATTSGNILCTLPSNIAGAGYKIRIVSSSPAGVSNELGLTIHATPTVSGSSNSPVCEGGAINFTAGSNISGVSYSWTGVSSFNSAMQNPVINNSLAGHAGDYYVVANNNGCKSIPDTVTVVVNPSPGGLATGSNSPVCAGDSIKFTASSAAAGVSYNWSGPGSYISAIQSPVIPNSTTAMAGTYTVTALLGNCSSIVNVPVTVSPLPAKPVAASNSPLCEGATLNLSASSATIGVSYSWAGPASYTSMAQNPQVTSITTVADGDYIVSATVNGCTAKDTVTVVISAIPTQPQVSSNSPVCLGNDIQLTASSMPATASYTWSGPGYTSSQQNPVLSNAHTGMSGSYTVTAHINNCFSQPATVNVIVLHYPSSVAVYALPGDSICAGQQVTYVAVASNGGAAPQYQWMKNNALVPGATGVTYITSNIVDGDMIGCIMIPNNSCPLPDTSAIVMTVLPYLPASVSVTADPGTLLSPWQLVKFTATAVNGGDHPSFQWKRNGADVIGAVSDTWSANNLSDNDTIHVVMTSSYRCPQPAGAVSNKLVVNLKTAVDDPAHTGGLILYPNPNNGTFAISLPPASFQYEGDWSVEVVNAVGQTILSSTSQIGNAGLTVSLPENAGNGVYSCILSDGARKWIGKLIVVR